MPKEVTSFKDPRYVFLPLWAVWSAVPVTSVLASMVDPPLPASWPGEMQCDRHCHPKKQQGKRERNTIGQSNLPLFYFYFPFFSLPILSDNPPMTMLATRLSLTAATAIGRFYDPSTRNGPAPLCRNPSHPPSLLCELCPSKNSPSRTMLTPSAGPSANAGADSRHKATSSVFSSGCGCRSSANHTTRSRRIYGQSHHTATATVSPASEQA